MADEEVVTLTGYVAVNEEVAAPELEEHPLHVPDMVTFFTKRLLYSRSDGLEVPKL